MLMELLLELCMRGLTQVIKQNPSVCPAGTGCGPTSDPDSSITRSLSLPWLRFSHLNNEGRIQRWKILKSLLTLNPAIQPSSGVRSPHSLSDETVFLIPILPLIQRWSCNYCPLELPPAAWGWSPASFSLFSSEWSNWICCDLHGSAMIFCKQIPSTRWKWSDMPKSEWCLVPVVFMMPLQTT